MTYSAHWASTCPLVEKSQQTLHEFFLRTSTKPVHNRRPPGAPQVLIIPDSDTSQSPRDLNDSETEVLTEMTRAMPMMPGWTNRRPLMVVRILHSELVAVVKVNLRPAFVRSYNRTGQWRGHWDGGSFAQVWITATYCAREEQGLSFNRHLSHSSAPNLRNPSLSL